MTRSRQVWADGVFFAGEVKVYDAFGPAARAGDGVFETLRAERGALRTLPLHLTRLGWAAGRCGALPVPTVDYAAVIDELLARAELTVGRCRITLHSPGAAPRLVVTVEPQPDADDWQRHGLTLAVSPWRRGANDPTAAVKIGSRAFYEMARLEAQQRAADDALLIGEHDELLETTIANVFLVLPDETICTPTLCDGFLPGITRSRLLRALRAAGLGVRERTVRRRELASAREVFLTNAVHGVLPVRRIDDWSFPCPGQTRRWTELLERT